MALLELTQILTALMVVQIEAAQIIEPIRPVTLPIEVHLPAPALAAAEGQVPEVALVVAEDQAPEVALAVLVALAVAAEEVVLVAQAEAVQVEDDNSRMKMKKLSILLVCTLTLSSVYGQTVDDIALFSKTGLNGSPRFTAMGGAFTSLGNDASAIGINPASGAVNNHSAINFSFGVNNESASLSNFYGNGKVSNDLGSSFQNFGLNLVLAENQSTRYSLAISINRLANFNRNFNLSGLNNEHTLGEYWADESAGLNTDVISDDAFAAWESYLLIADSNGNIEPNGYAYGDSINGELVSNSNVNYSVDQWGSFNETNIAFAIDQSSKLYYGFSLGFPTLNFRREEFITEDIQNNDDPPYSASSYTYRRLNDINANGFNLKLGLIYRPLKALRVGISYESPSWYTIDQFYETDVSATFSQAPEPGVGITTNSAIMGSELYSYRLRTPSILRVGLSGVLGKKLVLSADYQLHGLGDNRLYTNNNSFNIDESLLTNDFQPALNNLLNTQRETFALGAEFKLGSYFLRAGYRLDESFYKSDFQANTVRDLETISGGIGYNNGPWSFDITYLNSKQDFTQVGYRGFDENGEPLEVIDDISVSSLNHNVVFGVGFKF